MRPAKRFAPRVKTNRFRNSIIIPPPSSERVSLIIDIICERYAVLISELRKQGRQRNVCDARMVIYHFVLKYEPNATMLYIGSVFNRSHSAVSVAIQGFNDLYDTDIGFREEMGHIDLRTQSLIKIKK